MVSKLTTAALLSEGWRRLAAAIEHPGLDAEVLLAHVLQTVRARLHSHSSEQRAEREREAYLALVDRRARGEPLAYLIGHKEFWSLELAVGPEVLVPRPETELLVERALQLRPEPGGEVADLGTGSGAIALALARERPGWHIVATDLSQGALAVARRNASRLGASTVEFVAGNWFAPLAGRSFHLVLSNPPYVAAADPLLRMAPLNFEPRIALTPGDEALADLRSIIEAAPEHLERGGWLLLEHGATQAAPVARELEARGFSAIRAHRDLAGHERVTEGRWP
ncbi:MAG TPA: peptide chain release factor N(5)-glutamine methyltransferase [Steroidobacteraceae bacterium]|nr:peptide chain release factor N(5)-glutamine methyltransferase [Steroidobacteraceae bacterium]